MTDLFLRSVEFSNFRVYGDSYAFEFPACPGVTLITGGNGLGKTSFFDGVEWALTNQVGRFNDIPVDGRRRNVDPLTRIGAPEGSHRVSLQFSDGSVIDRGAGFEAAEDDIIRLLKRPDWAEISSLHGYLSITHFFGQSSAQRFSLKRPTDQWEALKGPAGVDRINTLRERMCSQGVKRAFTRVIEGRIAKLDQANMELSEWNQLIDRRGRARQLASAESAIPPSDLRAEVTKLGSELVAATGRDSWTIDSETELPEADLEAVSAVLRAATERSATECERMEELTGVLSRFESAGSESATLNTRIQAINTRLTLAREELKRADNKLREAAEILRLSEFEASHSHNRLVSIERVSAAAKQLEGARAQQEVLKGQVLAAETAVGEAETHCEQLRKQLADLVVQRSKRRELADRVSLARTRSQISDSTSTIQSEIARVSRLISDRDPTELHEKRERWIAAATATNERIATVTSELRKHDDRSRAISEAVTTIAHRLRTEDTSCPVCATAFIPGELLQLVLAQQAAGSSPSSTLAATLAEDRLTVESFRLQISEADRKLSEVAQLEASLAAYQSQQSELHQLLVEAGGTPGTKYDDSGVGEMERELQFFDEALARATTPEALSVLVAEAEASVKAEAAKRASTQQLRAEVINEIQVSRSVLLKHPSLWSLESGMLVDAATELETAEAHARAAGERVAEARASLATAETARDSLQGVESREMATLAALDARLATLSRELQEGRRRWTEAGQPGEPEAIRLEFVRQATIDRANRLRAIELALERLILGYRKWIDDEQLRKLEEEVSDKVTAGSLTSEDEYHAQLTGGVRRAEAELTLALSARMKVDEVGARMQELSKAYADGVLVPLNLTIKRFARALMTWSDTAVSYKAEHHASRSELRPTIVRGELDGTTNQVDMNPALYFSEGQLSALSVAALFAASTTFGWSRWRGLLLDDPLQHNDVIHASAFMDLLRQLVLRLGYQIVISTHNSAEAEFLSRKCRNAGISYRVHELFPRGAGGMVNSDVAVSRAAQG